MTKVDLWRRFNGRRDHYVAPGTQVTACGISVNKGRLVKPSEHRKHCTGCKFAAKEIHNWPPEAIPVSPSNEVAPND